MLHVVTLMSVQQLNQRKKSWMRQFSQALRSIGLGARPERLCYLIHSCVPTLMTNYLARSDASVTMLIQLHYKQVDMPSISDETRILSTASK